MKRTTDSDRFRLTTILLICAAVTGLVLFLHWKFVPLRQTESVIQDWQTRLGRPTPPDPRLVLIGIDQATYAGEILEEEAENNPVLAALRGNFPWSRDVWAALIERLAEAGAKVIVLDLVFANSGPGDDAFRETLIKYHDKVVIGAYLDMKDLETGGANTSITVPAEEIIQVGDGRPAALDNRVGFVNVWQDSDGVLRRARFRVANRQLGNVIDAEPDVLLESLASRALAKLGERDHIPSELEPLRFRYTAPPDLGFPAHRIGDVVWPSTWEANYQGGEFFKDKLVLIGPTAHIFQDRHRTPFAVPKSEMLGPELHLNIINAALHDSFLRELPFAGNAAIIAFFGMLAMIVSTAIHSPLTRVIALVMSSGTFLLIVQGLYDSADLVVTVASPLLALNGGALLAMTFDFVIERIQRARLRNTMSLYFSPRVMEAVLADPGSMEPRRADVTLLLTDLRNSTPLAELLGPIGMFNLLNSVFEVQTEAIMGEDGNLEHFLGDQFLSYWGAPQPQPEGANQAERAALKLIRSMEALRESFTPEVQALFGYGVALHSGSVLVGNKGSSKRLDYGLVGDTVNEAARVEALTKMYGLKLLVTRETLAMITRECERRLLDRVVVKGKSVPVELYEVENPCTPENYPELCRRYEAAYADYQDGRFAEAKNEFEGLARESRDGPSTLLAARCARLIERPVADWKGIWNMETK